jgi:hypothetical protein
MDIKELENVFRLQTTASDTYTPKDTLDYLLIKGQNKVTGTHPAKEMATLLEQLNEHGYVFDAYRDRTPVFIVPEIITPM